LQWSFYTNEDEFKTARQTKTGAKHAEQRPKSKTLKAWRWFHHLHGNVVDEYENVVIGPEVIPVFPHKVNDKNSECGPTDDAQQCKPQS